jgi:predicted protein tyrosine phosphatase
MNPVPEDAVVVVGRTGAGKILCSPRRRAGFAYLVSIGGPQEREPAGFLHVPNRLRLVFEDAATQEDGGASRTDVEQLVRFARRIDFQRGRLLVHCQAGISRSSAAAIIVLATVLGPGHEHEAVSWIRRTQPQARPNQRMIWLADQVLDTGGALVRALE